MLELSHIEKYYNPGSVNEMCLFQDFNLSIPKGQFVSVVGSNGSGKTSMLNLICGSIEADGGKICVNDTDITSQKEYVRHKKIGRVYQNPAAGTCPGMTVLENLSIADKKKTGYGLGRCVRKERREEKLETRVGALSGGQRQVLALLMATMTPIDFLILDEHTAALDPRTAEIVMELTDRIVREKKMTTIMVTHNLRYALEYGDRLLMMHQGKAVLDKEGEEKKRLKVEEIMGIFNRISVECGN